MKKLICILLLAMGSSLVINAQVIKDSDLDNAVVTIEHFLNNTKFKSRFNVISVHKWNPSYHNGYESKGILYKLNSFPYTEIKNIYFNKIPGKIEISLSPDNSHIIVVLMFDHTYYAFYNSLEQKNGKYKILNIPYGLHEGD